MKRQPSIVVAALLVCVGLGLGTARDAVATTDVCVGDCNHDSRLTVDELVLGVSMALGSLPIARCPEFHPGGEQVAVEDLIAAVRNALNGCSAQPNRAPQAAAVSIAADLSTPYVQKQLIGSDPDNDTITYELVADEQGTGYSFAYVNPDSGMLYVTLTPDFQGSIVLPYRVTDGKLFSNTASATLDVGESIPSQNGGLEDVSPREYASFPTGFYNAEVLGAPGLDPTLPSSVDLSSDFPLPGNQGNQNSCVGWSLGYAIKSYQERVENGWSLEAPEHQFSPSYIYNQLNGGRDIGIVYTQALNLVVDDGVATLARMPYDDRDYLTQPSAAAHQEAARYRMKTWKAANGVLDAKAALANHLPVFMVIQLVQDIHALRGPDAVYNTFNGAWEGGHGVAAVGYDDNRYGGAFKIMNSWGRAWGDGGYFWMPYWTLNYFVDTANGPSAVLTGCVVLEDLPDPETPDQDPVDPTPPAELPDLQVTNWYTTYDGRPGGSGSLQYTVTNTGIATAPAGSFVALVLSRDPTFRSSNTVVVYESIPFSMAPGTTAYRDANNAIAYHFPPDLEPGQYYMALWTDIWDDVWESREDNNISAATTLVDIVNTLPDIEARTWYSRWDAAGNGSLTYDIVNNGAVTAPAGWDISLVLSPNAVFGDGDDIFVFSEAANYAIDPGGSLYRDESAPAAFSIVYDIAQRPVPAGVYYLALWLDSGGTLAESSTANNVSMSWSTVSITRGFDASAAAANSASPPLDGAAAAPSAREAYNGKLLPDRQAAVRTVRISDTAQGRQVEFLDADPGPRVKPADTHVWSKTARARQQVIFPIAERKPMPSAD